MQSFGVLTRSCSILLKRMWRNNNSPLSAACSSYCFAQSCFCATCVERVVRALSFRRPPSLNEKICREKWKRLRFIHSIFVVFFQTPHANQPHYTEWRTLDRFLTCDSCVLPALVRRFGERPLPPDGRHLCGTFARVGDAGAVLLVGGARSLLAAAQSVVSLGVGGAHGCARVRGLPIKCSGAGRGDFLPLKPAGQRRLGVEVEVPAPAVLLADLPQPLLQFPAQLLAVHRAEQTPAHRLSAPDGMRRWSHGSSFCLPSALLWSAQCRGAILKAAGRTMLCLYTMSGGRWLAAAAAWIADKGGGEGAPLSSEEEHSVHCYEKVSVNQQPYPTMRISPARKHFWCTRVS